MASHISVFAVTIKTLPWLAGYLRVLPQSRIMSEREGLYPNLIGITMEFSLERKVCSNLQNSLFRKEKELE